MDNANELVVTNHQTPAGINYKNVFKILDESLQVHVYLVAQEYTEQSNIPRGYLATVAKVAI